MTDLLNDTIHTAEDLLGGLYLHGDQKRRGAAMQVVLAGLREPLMDFEPDELAVFAQGAAGWIAHGARYDANYGA